MPGWSAGSGAGAGPAKRRLLNACATLCSQKSNDNGDFIEIFEVGVERLFWKIEVEKGTRSTPCRAVGSASRGRGDSDGAKDYQGSQRFSGA
jgi:hypothetical protein